MSLPKSQNIMCPMKKIMKAKRIWEQDFMPSAYLSSYTLYRSLIPHSFTLAPFPHPPVSMFCFCSQHTPSRIWAYIHSWPLHLVLVSLLFISLARHYTVVSYTTFIFTPFPLSPANVLLLLIICQAKSELISTTAFSPSLCKPSVLSLQLDIVRFSRIPHSFTFAPFPPPLVNVLFFLIIHQAESELISTADLFT